MNLKSVETRIFPCQSKAAEQLNIYTSVKIFEAPQISKLLKLQDCVIKIYSDLNKNGTC